MILINTMFLFFRILIQVIYDVPGEISKSAFAVRRSDDEELRSRRQRFRYASV